MTAGSAPSVHYFIRQINRNFCLPNYMVFEFDNFTFTSTTIMLWHSFCVLVYITCNGHPSPGVMCHWFGSMFSLLRFFFWYFGFSRGLFDRQCKRWPCSYLCWFYVPASLHAPVTVLFFVGYLYFSIISAGAHIKYVFF